MSDDEPAAAISMVFKFSPPIALSDDISAARASTSWAKVVPTDSPNSATRSDSPRTIRFLSCPPRLFGAARLGLFKPVEQACGVGSRERFHPVGLALLDGIP